MRSLLGLLNHNVPMKTTLEGIPCCLQGSDSSLRAMEITSPKEERFRSAVESWRCRDKGYWSESNSLKERKPPGKCHPETGSFLVQSANCGSSGGEALSSLYHPSFSLSSEKTFLSQTHSPRASPRDLFGGTWLSQGLRQHFAPLPVLPRGQVMGTGRAGAVTNPSRYSRVVKDTPSAVGVSRAQALAAGLVLAARLHGHPGELQEERGQPVRLLTGLRMA